MARWFRVIQDIGVREGLDGFDARRVRLLNSLCVLGVSASMVSLPWIFVQENLQGLWGNLLSQLGLLGVLALQHKGWYRTAAMAITLTGLLGVCLQVLIFPDTWGIHFWLLPLSLLPQVLFFRDEARLPGILGGLMFIAFCACVLHTGGRDGHEAPVMAAQILSSLTLVLIGGAVRQASTEAEREALAQSERADAILHMSLPPAAVARLKSGRQPPFEVSNDECTILMADIVGFTKLASSVPPRELIVMLDRIFARYDACAEAHGLEKLKTIGDAYMIAAGAPEPLDNHPDVVASLALDLVHATRELAVELDIPLEVRIGIHTGVAWGGVIGQTRIAFDLWGDTVNVASRMERHGVPGRIQITDDTARLLDPRFVLEERGVIAVKNRGKVLTHFLEGVRESVPAP